MCRLANLVDIAMLIRFAECEVSPQKLDNDLPTAVINKSCVCVHLSKLEYIEKR